ncbi:MAG: hemolysin III family protein [Desulfofustis sp.]|nr:hemolysin III family protein [Desulfofustis sp.]
MHDGEKFNFITHLIGSVAALIGLVALVIATVGRGELLPLISVTVYGASLVLLYVFSTLNHSMKGKAKNIFQKLDFLAIYLLIAGTYTPFSLITLRDSGGWAILSLVWGLAILGIYLEFQSRSGQRIRSLFIYLIMGWVILLAVKPLQQALGWAGFSWMLVGGLFYTLGMIFYVYDEKVKYFHGIWHLCVLTGSATQFITVYFFVL